MSTHIEIERKFLIKELPNHLTDLPHVQITQGYLAFDKRGLEVRLRKIDEARYLAIKIPHDDTRVEREITLNDKQFEELWPATKGRRLRKTRYCVPNDGLMIEIDVYQGVASGMIVAEVEYPDRASAGAFRKPDWLGVGNHLCREIQQSPSGHGIRSANSGCSTFYQEMRKTFR
jgi:adenylate cyclase